MDCVNVFTNIYENKIWGDNKHAKYNGSSGPGSSLSINTEYIAYLKQFIRSHGIKTVVDIGCGDFRCGKNIYDDLDITYQGYDVYQKIIDNNRETHDASKYSFDLLDCSNISEAKSADICIIKDVLQHMPTTMIVSILDECVKKFKYVWVCNCISETECDIELGGFRGLKHDKYPLNRYDFKELFRYFTKQVSIYSETLPYLQYMWGMWDTIPLPEHIYAKQKHNAYLLGLPMKLNLKDDILKLVNKFEYELPGFKDFFNQLRPVCQADIGRYLVIYYEGGIYLDNDIIISENEYLPLVNESLCKYSDGVWFIEEGTILHNAIFGCIKNSKKLKEIILHAIDKLKKLNKSLRSITDQDVLLTTGPSILSDILTSNKDSFIIDFDTANKIKTHICTGTWLNGGDVPKQIIKDNTVKHKIIAYCKYIKK